MSDQQQHLIDGEGQDHLEEVPSADTPTRKSNAQLVWDAIIDLANQDRHITRKVLCEVTNLKAQIVDDHVERLILHDKLRRLGYGVLEVVEQFPEARPISKTVMPNGLVKLEVDDVLLELTPKEARTLAGMFSGELNTLLDIESSSHYLVRVAELANQVRELQNTVTALRRGTGHPNQLGFDGFQV